MKELMQVLLAGSKDTDNWPYTNERAVHSSGESLELVRRLSDEDVDMDFPAWDMRTVEHTLCEFDKYERVRTGEGRPRQVFRP